MSLRDSHDVNLDDVWDAAVVLMRQLVDVVKRIGVIEADEL